MHKWKRKEYFAFNFSVRILYDYIDGHTNWKGPWAILLFCFSLIRIIFLNTLAIRSDLNKLINHHLLPQLFHDDGLSSGIVWKYVVKTSDIFPKHKLFYFLFISVANWIP